MEKNEYSKVRAIEVEAPKTVSELLYSMSNTGFQGRSLARVAEVYERMIKAPETGILFGYAGSLSTTGQWKVINWLIENRYIDILVSTGANITDDIVEAMGRHYGQGIPT
ncbi:MAG: deoxyhypusine synthase family protein, partial [Candidatus Dadabacteria bacterium]|nr:deoxyhypusine synthase family protein [Candidatus Dadabacteria bacterium]